MFKWIQTLLWCLSFIVVFVFNGIAQDLKMGGSNDPQIIAVGEKSSNTFTYDGTNALLWNNFLTQSTTAIVAGEWGGLPAGANQVLDAEDFFVPSATTWTINEIAATGFYSVAVDANSWGVAFYTDNAGVPGTLIQAVTVPVVAGNPNPAGFLSSPVVLNGGGAGTRYWISIYAKSATATTINEFRWNWYASEDPQILSEPYLRDDPGFFGTPISWTPYTTLGLSQFNALMFQLFGTQSGGCPVAPASNPSPASGSVNVSINPGNATWTNGAGTTQVEVFFGPAGNTVSVYSGPAITSLAIPGPLQYATTYEWKVVCKNDTCNALADVWSFTTIPDPSFIINENFENATFPPAGWTLVNTVGTTPYWSRQTTASGYGTGTASSRYAFYNSLAGDDQSLITPTFSPITVSGSLTFDHAYATYTGNEVDRLQLETSTNGGTTWVILITIDGGPSGPLATAPPQAGVFTPTAAQWATKTFGIPVGTNKIRFRALSAFGNNLWVDNIRVVDVVPVELTSFTATANNQNVTLNWSTATELNNSGFQIERSNGSEYQVLGFVAGHGTTTNVQKYSYIDQNVNAGNYSYRLKQVDFDGTFEYSNEIQVEFIGIQEFALGQNYPNPFNPSTKISFNLAVDSKVSLKIFDVLGQEVATLINGQLAAGSQEIIFNASSLNSGVYFYKIDASGIDGQKFSSIKKMILTK